MDKRADAISGGRARCAIEVALLDLAVSIAYANSFAGVFQFDDFFVIVENPAVHSWTAWWADLARGGIRPLRKLSYVVNVTAGGSSAFPTSWSSAASPCLGQPRFLVCVAGLIHGVVAGGAGGLHKGSWAEPRIVHYTQQS